MRNVLSVLMAVALGLGVNFAQAEEQAAPAATPAAVSAVEKGKKISFEYTLTVDGKAIDSNVGKEPIVYTEGDATIIPGLATQLSGMKAGDQKTVTVQPQDGYGLEDSNAIQEVAKTDLPKDITPEAGMVLELRGDDGRSIPGVISKVSDDKITINFNHPLAGKVLEFDVKILNVE